TLADELRKAQGYVSEILSERERTVSGLNLRLVELENEKASLARRGVEEQAARLAEAERIRAAARESLAEREREAAVLRREIEERQAVIEERQAAAASLQERVSSQNRMLSDLQKEKDEKTSALKDAEESLERLEEEYQKTAAESLERHGHLAYAMQ